MQTILATMRASTRNKHNERNERTEEEEEEKEEEEDNVESIKVMKKVKSAPQSVLAQKLILRKQREIIQKERSK